MTSPFLPSSFSYGDAPWGGSVIPTIVAARDPLPTDIGYPAGYLWLSDLSQGGSGGLFFNAGYTLGVVNWSNAGNSFANAGVPGASPRAANGKSGIATFSGVNIAAAAFQTFVINNSSITSASIVDVSIYGCTPGAALTIQSVTAGQGTITVVVNNGTAQITDTANLTVVFNVIN